MIHITHLQVMGMDSEDWILYKHHWYGILQQEVVM